MGDAGQPTPLLEADLSAPGIQQDHTQPLRDIHVLVTGFGPFKSFDVNPSWLIASALPRVLEALPPSPLDSSAPPHPVDEPQPQSGLVQRLLGRNTQPTRPPVSSHSQQPLRPPNPIPYRIHIHTYGSPVYVAYAPTSTLIPSLLTASTNPDRIDYDYILHIGLASNRTSYTLETIGHRDNYVIPDIDEATGYLPGEKIWKDLHVPDRLDVGWEGADVLKRWISEVHRREDQLYQDKAALQISEDEQVVRNFKIAHGIFGLRALSSAPAENKGQQAASTIPRTVVKLSRDAGRFLCEFILMCSLVYRYLESTNPYEPAGSREKLGKVAFLHVPMGVGEEDVAKGVMVAESAIKAVVASWEDGFRNPLVYTPVSDCEMPSRGSVEQAQLPDGAVEEVGTGDR